MKKYLGSVGVVLMLVSMLSLMSADAFFRDNVDNAPEKNVVKVLSFWSKETSQASGVFISPDKILTVDHAIPPDGAKGSVFVLSYEGNKYRKAVVRWRDADRDLAVIQIPNVKHSYARFKDRYERGLKVLSWGNPVFGDFQVAATEVVGLGYFSAMDKTYIRPWLTIRMTEEGPYKGFSGGPIFDLDGNVLGITDICVPNALICLAITSAELTQTMAGTLDQGQTGEIK